VQGDEIGFAAFVSAQAKRMKSVFDGQKSSHPEDGSFLAISDLLNDT
jgi:hypothetical protein